MTPREALRAEIREAALAGVEFALDQLRNEYGDLTGVAACVWNARQTLADEIATFYDSDRYASEAHRVLLALVEQAERAAFTDDVQTTRAGELA